MTSRTYCRIGIVFFLLLVLACSLVSQAASLSSTRRTETSSGEEDAEKYKEMSKLLQDSVFKKRYLKDFEESARCPFKVLNYLGFTRVLCDFSKCSRNNTSCGDCEQVYLQASDIFPKASRKKRRVTSADVEAGCIYVPKQRSHSKETPGPAVVV